MTAIDSELRRGTWSTSNLLAEVAMTAELEILDRELTATVILLFAIPELASDVLLYMLEWAMWFNQG